MDLNGTYLGFSPTDESGVGLGELKLVITDETIAYWFATGLELSTDEAPRSEMTEMSPEELSTEFGPETDLTGVSAFKLAGDEGPVMVFAPEIPDEPLAASVALLRFVSDEIDAIFGPTFLFTPSQVAAGCFDQALAEIEKMQGDPGVIPRIANDGRRG